MTKKIIAGVLALTLVMGSAALPSGVFENVAEKTSITASAYGEKDEITSGDYKYGILNDGTVEIAKYMGSATALIIPTTLDGKKVTSIGYEAFANCTSLTNITIPDSITSIGYEAFANCTSLASVTIPNSITRTGYFSFNGCTSLTSITIPDSITSIGLGTFCGCKSLASITIPDSVTSIGADAFLGTAWYGNQADGVVYAGKFAYDYKGKMPANTSITLKSGTVGIADSAFGSCTSLSSVTIPSSVTSIGVCVFIGCTNLKNINVDSNNQNYLSFYGVLYNKDKTSLICYPAGTNLTSITIPSSVTKIDNCSFSNCTSLKSITIPDSVTSIGSYAYVDCTNLKSITIPNSVTDVGYEAFGYYYDADDNDDEKISDFKIYCYSGSAGERYAKNNEFDYELLTAPVVTTTTTKVTTTSAKATTTKKATTTAKPTTTTKKVTTTKKATTTTKKATTTTKKNVKKASVPKILDKAYTGKAICPAVKVKYGKTVLKKNIDYTVSYKYNKAIGKASVVIKGKGKYTGTKTVTFKINPKKQTAKLASYNNAFKASWTKDEQATGYQVMYATKSSFKGSKIVTAGKTTTSKKIKGKNKTTYYVKVRTYKTVKGTKYYGAWSTAKTVKTK